MQSTRLISIVLFFLAFTFFVCAKPIDANAELSRRADSTGDIVAVLNDLKGTVDGIVAQLTATADLNSLIGQLVSSINAAAASLAKIPPNPAGLQGAHYQDIVDVVVQLLDEILEALIKLPLATILNLILSLNLDAGLSLLLTSLGTLLDTVLRDVAIALSKILGDLSGILTSLGLTLTLVALGL